ncbi:hypothetical protein GCM10010123_04950 [Pilimelia anulata]|uniref:Ricin B lectin domain-containing protein n=1 Tax=Pilimelia anulata TaxID=53371 RepID=A0A8J3B1V1_9ACTN|nr:RICIN domain-containing protein [Pilimelia anulata]GGJ77905.1 hypothetical protein GCM10010123_04950 [Pilimelia anulata]
MRIRSIAAAGAAVALLGTGTAASAAPAVERATQVNLISLRLAMHPNQVANVEGDSQNNGARVILWDLTNAENERWEPESQLDGYVRLRAQSSGKCLNVAGGGNADGAGVIQYTCGTAANELWKFNQVGWGYQVVAKSSGKCLNVRGGVVKGNTLIQYTCAGGAGAANDVWLASWEQPK